MSPERSPGAGPLAVALDVRDPFSYLALGPALALGRELDEPIHWRPFRGHVLKRPTEPSADDDRSVQHRRHRAQMIAREIAIYGDAQGLTIRDPYRDAPADAVHRAWLWLRTNDPERLEPFLGESFRRYWSLALDAADVSAAARLVSECGADGASFQLWADAEGADALDREIAEAAEAGVSATPTYLVGDEVFLGRQHLPMIRWLLAGRTGPAPI